MFDEFKVHGFEYSGVVLRINSVQSYFNASMSLLTDSVRNDLFWSGKPIYTNITYPFQRNRPSVTSEPPKDWTAYENRNPVGSYVTFVCTGKQNSTAWLSGCMSEKQAVRMIWNVPSIP